ncbi:MAG: Gfo/Idh/MocA family oxidoreductase [Deltaproteobacteria bacterium]
MVVRYGIIGTGLMGVEHAMNLAVIDGAEVVAAADPNAESREWIRPVLPPATALHAETGELLARDDVDVVVVASPNFTHRELLEEVMASGKHLLVEKPMCTTFEDAVFVHEAAKRYPGLFWVGLEYRYMPAVSRLVNEVHGGTAGRLRMVAIREHRFPFLTKVDDWNRFNRNTGGTFVEKCCHFFDLMRLLAKSEPVRVYCSGGQDVNHLDESYAGKKPDIWDNGFVIIDFANGIRGMLDLCMFAEGSLEEQEICAVGDRGKLEAFIPSSRFVLGKRNPKSIETEVVSVDEKVLNAGFHHGATYYQHQALLRALARRQPAEVSSWDGLMSVVMGLAAQISAEEQRAVEISEFDLPSRD